MIKNSKVNSSIIIALVLGLTIILPFIPLLIDGKVIYWGTSTTQFLPWLDFAFKSISQGNFPLWNPNNGMGSPFIANYQSAIFYIPNWILWFFYKNSQSLCRYYESFWKLFPISNLNGQFLHNPT